VQLRPITGSAIRILRHLHQHEEPHQSGVYIAKAIDISYVLFMRTAEKLRKEGLLVTRRGRNGGFSLGKPAAEISLYDVYLCMEKELHLGDFLKNETGHPIGDYMGSLQDGIVQNMLATTIADLA